MGHQGWRSIGGLVVGGSGDSAYKNLTLYPEVERKTFFSHADFAFTDTLGSYLETFVWRGEGQQQSVGNRAEQHRKLYQAGQPFRERAVSQRAERACGAGWQQSVRRVERILLRNRGAEENWNPRTCRPCSRTHKVTRVVAGLNGKYGDSWTWDAYYQYGKTTRDQIGDQYRTNWRYTMAVDAVTDTRVGFGDVGPAGLPRNQYRRDAESDTRPDTGSRLPAAERLRQRGLAAGAGLRIW